MSEPQFRKLVAELKRLLNANPKRDTVVMPKRTLRRVIYVLRHDPRYYLDVE